MREPGQFRSHWNDSMLKETERVLQKKEDWMQSEIQQTQQRETFVVSYIRKQQTITETTQLLSIGRRKEEDVEDLIELNQQGRVKEKIKTCKKIKRNEVIVDT